MLDCYRLHWAQEMSGCTENSLIQLAIDGQLNICTELPNDFKALRVNADGHRATKQKNVIGLRRVQIPQLALREYLTNDSAYISVFKSCDEPDIFYQSINDQCIYRGALRITRNEITRLSDSFAKQRAIIDKNMDVPKRADLINLVSLSKVVARRYNMTNAESCYWITDQLGPQNMLYDISGFALPKLIHSLKARGAPSACFNALWWVHPKNESKPIRSLDGISANGIAISKTDAEKFCLIPISELNELEIKRLPLNADDLKVVIRVSVIDLISLSKAVAKNTNMTNIDACEWITGDIIRKQLSVYSLNNIALPKLIEPKEGRFISALCYEIWSEYPDTDDIEIDRHEINASQVAIRKSDAEAHFSMSIGMLEELLPEKKRLYVEDKAIINEIPRIKNSGLEAEKQSHLSKELLILNQASDKFWGNADPAERDTHQKNEIVINWLIEQGYSRISAKQGATIIRPSWAAKGNY